LFAWGITKRQRIVSEALHAFIDKKQALTLPCEEEKELLTSINFFFSKMAYFNELIPIRHMEMSGGKELTEKMIRGEF
jgi:hypothetical protein